MSESTFSKSFDTNKQLVDRYREFIYALPGFMLVGYNENEISIDIKPDKLELAKRFIASSIEGVPITIRPRTEMPIFFSTNCGTDD